MTIRPIMTGAISALALAAAAGAVQAQPVAQAPVAESMFRATTLNLSATGEVKAAPDMATISLGVQSDAPSAEGAMEKNRTRMAQVIAALRKGGIADRDIQTSNLSLSPQYAYVQNEQPKLTGYQASNQVTLTVNDLNMVGNVIDATVGAGANSVGGITFGLKDSEAAENDARRKAVKALQAKASLYAQATGLRVGRLVTLSEGGGYSPAPPMPMYAMRMEKSDASTPVQAGQLDIRIDITGLYELTR